jgi:TolB protein
MVLSLAPIRAFAQDGDSISWCSNGVIYIRRVAEPGRIWATHPGCGAALALANRRALWDGPGPGANTVDNVELLTARPGSAAVTIGGLSFDKSNPGALQIHVSGAEGTLAYLDADTTFDSDRQRGVVRVVGRRSVRIPETRFALDLAVSGETLATIDALPGGCICNTAPAWSPAGDRIAFVSHRDDSADIYTIDVHGGELRRVTATLEDEQLVGWSSDGRKLAFTRHLGGGLFVASPDGTAAKRIATAYEAAWSPVDEHLASVEQKGLWVERGDGTGRRLLARGGYGPSWSPDGSRLAFINAGLRIISVAGGASKLVPGTTGAGGPSWSPDGTQIAYTVDAGIALLDVSTGRIRQVTMLGSGPLRWSPDGSQLLFERGSRAFVMRLDGLSPRRLRLAGDGEFGAVWSPDGATIAFTSVTNNTDTSTSTEISVGRPDGTQEQQLTQTVQVAKARTIAEVHDLRSGQVRFATDAASAAAVLVSSSFLGLVFPRPLRLELYDIHSGQQVRVVRLPASSSTFSISATHVVFRTGRIIRLLDGATGRAKILVFAGGSPTALSISGRRVAWVESSGTYTRIRDLVLQSR